MLKPAGTLPDGTSIVLTIKHTNINKKFALAVLNSAPLNYITCRYILSYGVRIFRNYMFELLPLQIPKSQRNFILLAEYLLFLNSSKELRSNYASLITFFDKKLLDPLVCELYFQKKLQKESIYPPTASSLNSLLHQYLHPIHFSQWYKLYSQRFTPQKKLNKTQKRKLEEYTSTNIQTLEQIYKNVVTNEQIEDLIKKITRHPWCKRILTFQ